MPPNYRRPGARWYAVSVGHRPGIYTSWAEANSQVCKFSGGSHKSFETRREAEAWLESCKSKLWIPSPGGSRTTVKFTSEMFPEGIHAPRISGEHTRQTSQDWMEYDTPQKVQIKKEESPSQEPLLYFEDFKGEESLSTSPSKMEEEYYEQSHREVNSVPITNPDIRPLSPNQNQVLEHILNGKNVFFTGPAGSGKSLILKHVTRHLHKLNKKFAITAPTGIAAVQLGGTTIHSFSGVGMGDKGWREYIGYSYSDGTQMGKRADIWKDIEVLIIDEISMLGPDLFEKLNKIARGIRLSKKRDHHSTACLNYEEMFFGGIQLVVCGDFYQLPPVPDQEGVRKCAKCGQPIRLSTFQDSLVSNPPKGQYLSIGIDSHRWRRCANKGCNRLSNSSVKYVFQTKTWAEATFKTVVLKKVHRQKDPQWIGMLTRIKHGLPSNAWPVLNYLQSLRRPLPIIDGVKPTILYTHRADVAGENQREFAKLGGPEVLFNPIDRGKVEFYEKEGRKEHVETLTQEQIEEQTYFKHLQTPTDLRLKIGAQVMLLYNKSQELSLVNGSRGVITGFVDCRHKDLKDLCPGENERATIERYYDAYGRYKFREFPSPNAFNKGSAYLEESASEDEAALAREGPGPQIKETTWVEEEPIHIKEESFMHEHIVQIKTEHMGSGKSKMIRNIKQEPVSLVSIKDEPVSQHSLSIKDESSPIKQEPLLVDGSISIKPSPIYFKEELVSTDDELVIADLTSTEDQSVKEGDWKTRSPPEAIYTPSRKSKKRRRRSYLTLPIVKFANGGRQMIITPNQWEQESLLAKGVKQFLSRIHIPLCLAWAATIHKAQGMTLDLVIVDISKSFEPGQAYVGLSRCRTPEGMQILGQGGSEALRRAIRCCPIVTIYDQMLQDKCHIDNEDQEEPVENPSVKAEEQIGNTMVKVEELEQAMEVTTIKKEQPEIGDFDQILQHACRAEYEHADAPTVKEELLEDEDYGIEDDWDAEIFEIANQEMDALESTYFHSQDQNRNSRKSPVSKKRKFDHDFSLSTAPF